MVAPRDKIKQGFAKRLNEALDEAEGCPGRTERGRIAWVAKRYKLSNEGAAKWLDGRSMPDQTHLAIIARDLNVTPQWLHANQFPKRPPKKDALWTAMAALWEQLDEEQREAVLDFAHYKAGRQDPRPNSKRTQHRIPRA